MIAGVGDRAGRGDQVHRRDHARVPARPRRSATAPAGASGLGAAPARARAARCALAAFVVANPYSVLDFSAFQAGVATQASLAGGADPVKLGHHRGQRHRLLPVDVHLGAGLGPVAGGDRRAPCCCSSRRRLAMALVLLPAPIAFIIFMGDQQRFFGRWLMPIFPIVALLGAYGAVELVRWLVRTRRDAGALLAGARGGGAAARPEPRRASIHNDVVLSRPGHPQPDPRVDGRPRPRRGQGGDRAGRRRQLGDRRRAARCPATPTGARWQRYPTWLTDVDANGNPLPGRRAPLRASSTSTSARCARRCSTSTCNSGYCWVVIGSLQAGPLVRRSRRSRPGAIAYYAAAGQPGQAASTTSARSATGTPRGAVQLRLVDRLLPAPVPPARAGDERLPT